MWGTISELERAQRPQKAGRLVLSPYRVETLGESFDLDGSITADEARLKGMELAYRFSNGHWRVDANLTLQDTEDRSTGQSLLRRPDEKASITVDRLFDGGSWIGFEWVYTGNRDDFGGIPLESYRLLNLRGGWKFLPEWQFEVRGDNLADEDYQPAGGFNAPGRSWFISLAWMP